MVYADSHSSHRLKDVEARDVEESAFLRLSGELRNRIYELAFGRKIIHVWYEDFQIGQEDGKLALVEVGDDAMEFRIDRRGFLDYAPFLGMVGALHDPSNRAILDRIPQREIDEARGVDNRFPHLRIDLNKNNFSPDRLPVPVQLLRVSRKIYNEAAKFLYADNLFIFHTDGFGNLGHTLKSFALRTSLEQRRVIKNIAMDRVDSKALAESDLHSVLPEIQHFLLDIHVRCNWVSKGAGPRSRTTHAVWQALCEASPSMASSSLVGAGVRVSIYPYREAELRDFETFAASAVERMLLDTSLIGSGRFEHLY